MAKIVFLMIGLVAGALAQDAKMQKITAIVQIQPDPVKYKDLNVSGVLMFTQMGPNTPVSITGVVNNLSPGAHGFHVHDKGDMRNGCLSTGPHFNPKNSTHGAPSDRIRHVGDLGNIQADSTGTATVNITDSVISLTGPNSILGRGVVVHSMQDDLGKGGVPLSLTTGNAGDRLACGIIAILSGGSIPNSASVQEVFLFTFFIPLTALILQRRMQ